MIHTIKAYDVSSQKGKGPWVLIQKEEFTTRKEAIIQEKERKTLYRFVNPIQAKN